MDAIDKELQARKDEIQNAIRRLFETNMKITDWDVPEADDKKAAHILLEIMQEALENVRRDVQSGKYDDF